MVWVLSDNSVITEHWGFSIEQVSLMFSKDAVCPLHQPAAGLRRRQGSPCSQIAGRGQGKRRSCPSFPRGQRSSWHVGCSLLNLTPAAKCHMKLQPTATVPFSECSLCSWSNLELLRSHVYSDVVSFWLGCSATPVIITLVYIGVSTYKLLLEKYRSLPCK